MVSSPEKVNRRGEDGDGDSTLGLPGAFATPAFASPYGDRVLWSAGQGTIADPDAGTGFGFARGWELRDRGPNGWTGRAVHNVAAAAGGADGIAAMKASSADFGVQAWRHLAYLFPSGSRLGTRVFGDAGGTIPGSGWYQWLTDPAITGQNTGDDKALIADRGEFMFRWASSGGSERPYRGLMGPSDPSARGYPDEQQLVTVDATGGTFRLTFDGRTTGTIAENSAAAVVQTRLETLANVGTGNVSVAGNDGGPWTVTFIGVLGRTDLPTMTANSASLTGGAQTAVVSPIHNGVPAPASAVTQVDGRAPYRSGPPDWLPYELVSECTGTIAGGDATEIPARVDTGAPFPELADDSLGTVECEEGSVVSRRGAAVGDGLDTMLIMAASLDGNRVFLTSPDPGSVPTGIDVGAPGGCVDATADAEPTYGADSDCTPQLYVRQYDSQNNPTLRWISRSEVGGQNPDGLFDGAYFESASSDGRYVFFRTRSPLTVDDPNGGCGAPCTTGSASSSSWDLYRYELPSDIDDDPAGPEAGGLLRITGGPNGNSDPSTNPFPSSTGRGSAVRHVSDDGQRVYFVTRAPLDLGPDDQVATADDPWNAAPEGGGTVPSGTVSQNSTRNLYLYDGDADTYQFITQLPYGTPGSATLEACASANFVPAPIRGAQGGAKQGSCVRGTHSGDAVVFESPGRLTADDGDSASDVFLYDAKVDELVRVSAPPVGAVAYECTTQGQFCNGDLGFAPSQWGDDQSTGGLSGLRHHNLSEDEDGNLKAVYFESRLPLVGNDVNGLHFDVYEWRNGALSLMSPGESSDHAFYSGNSTDGTDVFFHTSQRIDPREIDAKDGDIYDFRIGGGFGPPPVIPPVCNVLGDGCQGPGGNPVVVSPVTGGQGDDNATPGPRVKLTVLRPGAKAARRAARTGRLKVKVRSSATGRVKVVARAKVRKGKRLVTRVVARKVVRAKAGKAVAANLRLSKAARRRLAGARRLGITIIASMGDARPSSVKFALKRAGR